ncbi:MAG: hypothetical protein LUH07_01730 [Lachnospiraceae bacterium]|nr:hypothetical protein [Lachnospiraceae bacterium]
MLNGAKRKIFKEYRAQPDGKEMSNAQKVISWRSALPKGMEYKTRDILLGTGMNNKQLQKAKNNNKTLAALLEADSIEKKGYYKVS